MPQNKKLVVLMLVLAALVVVSVYVWQSGILLKKQPPATQKPVESLSSQIAGLRNALISQAKFSIPYVTSSSTISSVKDLPAQLAVLVPTDYSNSSFESVKYKSGKTGYLLTYLVNQKPAEFFSSQVNLIYSSKDWKVINASTGLNFALIEAESSVYRVQIEHSMTADNQDQVIVKIYKK